MLNENADQCLVVGIDSNTNGKFNVLVGDHLNVIGDRQTAVGETLFGATVPDGVKKMVEEYPAELFWLIRIMYSVTPSIPKGEAN